MFAFKSFFLVEDRVQWLKDNLTSISSEHDALATKREPKDIIDHWAEHDPHPKKAYTQWIVNKYHRGDFRQEDGDRVRTALSNFDRYKGKLEKKDIGQYKDLNSVEDAVQPHLGTAASGREEERQIKDEGADLIHDDGKGLTVHTLKTHDAACRYGAGTKWCTASKEYSGHFDNYSKRGPIHVLQTPDKRKYQFHFESGQIMDEQDKPADPHGLVKKYPGIKDIEEFKGKHPAFDSKESFIHKAVTGQKYQGFGHPITLDDRKNPVLQPQHMEAALHHEVSSENADWNVLSSGAGHPSTPSHVIDSIVKKASEPGPTHYAKTDILHRVASSPNISKTQSVHHIINSKDENGRAALASNPHVSQEHLEQLHKSTGKDENTVRFRIARNPSTHPDRLHKYVTEGSVGEGTNALHNPSSRPETFEEAFKKPYLWGGLASSPHTPDHMLHAMLTSGTTTAAYLHGAIKENMNRRNTPKKGVPN